MLSTIAAIQGAVDDVPLPAVCQAARSAAGSATPSKCGPTISPFLSLAIPARASSGSRLAPPICTPVEGDLPHVRAAEHEIASVDYLTEIRHRRASQVNIFSAHSNGSSYHASVWCAPACHCLYPPKGKRHGAGPMGQTRAAATNRGMVEGPASGAQPLQSRSILWNALIVAANGRYRANCEAVGERQVLADLGSWRTSASRSMRESSSSSAAGFARLTSI